MTVLAELAAAVFDGERVLPRLSELRCLCLLDMASILQDAGAGRRHHRWEFAEAARIEYAIEQEEYRPWAANKGIQG